MACVTLLRYSVLHFAMKLKIISKEKFPMLSFLSFFFTTTLQNKPTLLPLPPPLSLLPSIVAPLMGQTYLHIFYDITAEDTIPWIRDEGIKALMWGICVKILSHRSLLGPVTIWVVCCIKLFVKYIWGKQNKTNPKKLRYSSGIVTQRHTTATG